MKPNSVTTNHNLSRRDGLRPSESAGQLLRQHCRDSTRHCCTPTTTSRLCRAAARVAVVEELSITKTRKHFKTRRCSESAYIRQANNKILIGLQKTYYTTRSKGRIQQVWVVPYVCSDSKYGAIFWIRTNIWNKIYKMTAQQSSILPSFM